MSGKRKKTDEEKTFATKRKHTNVTCKLSRMCKGLDLLAEIQSSCIVLKQVQLEAWHITNLYVLRCLENDIELPKLDQTFFGWCCQGARATGIREAKPKAEKEIKLGRQRKPTRSVNEEFRETVQLYRFNRDSTGGYISPPQFKYDGNIMLEVATQMRINAENMVVLHFKKQIYLGFIPYENIIKSNLEHFVLNLCEILRKVEASQQKDPNKKGIRSFSPLPYSNSYAAVHIAINGSTLQGFCARVFKKSDRRNPLDILLMAFGKALISPAKVCKSKELYLRRGFAVSQFETVTPNVTISKQEFNDMNHETKFLFASRLFANQITTNGYSASVFLTRPQVTSKPGTKNTNKKPKQMKTDEWNFLSDDYVPDALTAIDPGMRSLCTAVKHVEKVVEISTREYRHLAGMNKARCWHENLKKRKKRYAKTIDSIPSCKTGSYEQRLERLRVFWKNINFLLEFSAENAFLKWRFFQSRMKEKTVDAMAKLIVPKASPRVLVGYGDWSRRDRISGHAPSPVKGFRKALKKQATVAPVDEYRTSKLCSECHLPLDQALLLTKSRDQEVVLKETRNVLRCASSDRKATFLGRDINAARNILALLKCKLLGLGRLDAFCRGS